MAPGKDGPVPGAPAWPSPQPFTRGEKQWMSNAQNIGNWGDMQETVANTRIPYASTLVQTHDHSVDMDHEEGESPFERDTDMSILYEKDKPSAIPERQDPA